MYVHSVVEPNQKSELWLVRFKTLDIEYHYLECQLSLVLRDTYYGNYTLRTFTTLHRVLLAQLGGIWGGLIPSTTIIPSGYCSPHIFLII